MTDVMTTHKPVADQLSRVAVIVGSIRTDRFCPVPARWIAEEAGRRTDLDVDLVDLADHDIPPVLGGNSADAPLPESITELGKRLDRADAFIVVTPVYNRSFPGSIKNAVDWFYSEWQLKPVGFVSYGGITAGLQAIDALRGVFAEFHAVTLRDTITFANFWETFDHDGLPVDAVGASSLASGFLDQLTWWASTLREGRSRRFYPFGDTEPEGDIPSV